jgi:glyoxylase-like metal-dependent hydrolase (beta-lactamase superfamily II)
VEGLTKLPVSVLNSHTHNDHVSDNWRFSRIYGMDTAFTREHAKGSVAAAQEEIGPGAICGELPPGFDAKSYAVKPFHITDWIHGGEKIDLGGRVLEVISTPGHTPDSISLWDARNGLLFTGDMYYPGPIFLFRPETDLDAYEASIAKMAALGAKLLLPAHNLPVADPADLPRALAAMKQARSGKIKPVKGEHWSEYKFQGFSFLISK